MPPINNNKKIVLITLGSISLLSALFIYGKQELTKFSLEKQREAQKALAAPNIPIDHFSNLSLQAKAVYVYDVQTKKVLFQKNATIPLPLASLTKVMTAIVASENLEKNNEITINSKALEEEGDSGLKEGEKWNLVKLLSYMLMVSSNDGAQSVANVISSVNTQKSFVDLMNEKANQLGLLSMHFSNPTGLDNKEETIAGASASAKDMAGLLQYAVEHHLDIFKNTSFSKKDFSSNTTLHTAKNTDIIINDIPNVLASKTGYTDLAGGNLGIIFDRGLNEPVVIVVLGSTYDSRFTDVLSLASSTLETYNGSK
ncbi:MAG: serine hydrolase [Candidatus Paceibacterota bacterium]|jgi:D-alanyl-D-alanine carboxypeptidase